MTVDMKLGLSTYFFIDEKLEKEHAELVGRRRIESVELWGMPPHADYRDPDSWKRAGALFDGEGVRVNSVHAPFYESPRDLTKGRFISISSVNEKKRRKALEVVMRAAELMELVRSRILVVHFGTAFDPNRQRTHEALLSSLVSLQEFTAGAGIRLAFENVVSIFSTAGSMAGILDRYDFHGMGIALDTGHANLNEEPASAVRNCGARLLCLHASDNNGVNDEHLIPGEGKIDWREVCRALGDAGYDGDFTVEIRNAGDPDETLGKVRESWEKLIEPLTA
ncbi:MAG: sugar phosphate isomerase/epimerase [bacterium]